MTNVTIIKGAALDKWAEVQAAQFQPFIFIEGNGSRWRGEEPEDIQGLINMLENHALDFKTFGSTFDDYVTLDPCVGIYNPDYTPGCGLEQFIDGDRFYKCDGVYSYFGNFKTHSHGFNIHTNHEPTIKALNEAIRSNIERFKS